MKTEEVLDYFDFISLLQYEVMPPVLVCWPTVSETDVGNMVEFTVLSTDEAAP